MTDSDRFLTALLSCDRLAHTADDALARGDVAAARTALWQLRHGLLRHTGCTVEQAARAVGHTPEQIETVLSAEPVSVAGVIAACDTLNGAGAPAVDDERAEAIAQAIADFLAAAGAASVHITSGEYTAAAIDDGITVMRFPADPAGDRPRGLLVDAAVADYARAVAPADALQAGADLIRATSAATVWARISDGVTLQGTMFTVRIMQQRPTRRRWPRGRTGTEWVETERMTVAAADRQPDRR